MFTVRDARSDEREIVADLTRRAYAVYTRIMEPTSWQGLSDAIQAALASSESAQCLVADDDGEVIGSVMLYPPKADAYGDESRRVGWPEVRLVAVAPEARGRGVAQALMDECVRRARASGATDIGIHTSRSMRSAIRMYERMGFVRAPEHDFQPPGAERVEGYRLPLR